MNRSGKKCVLYPRVSTEMQVDGFSLDGQKNNLKRFADREEMEIVNIYEDAGKSGKSIEGRPAFKQMLYDIENGNGFPTEKVLISLVKNLNFKDKTEIYNLYAEIKESAPPDIIDFLVKNKDVVDAVRKIIEEKERCNHGY